MDEPPIKQQILSAIRRLPDDATLDDVAYVVCLYQMLAQGRADSAAGLGISSDEARKQFGITR